MPEKEMTNGFILQGPTEKEFPELTIKVSLKLEHLYQLKEIHRQHLITAVYMQSVHASSIILQAIGISRSFARVWVDLNVAVW